MTTVSKMIVALGGGGRVYTPLVSEKVREVSGQTVKPGAIQKWKEQNHVPHWARAYVVALALREGIEIPEDLKQPLALTG